MSILKEACVGSFTEAKKAWQLGADRIELCYNLAEGGTTPSMGTIKMAKEVLDIPICVIVRPRGGSFVYTHEEIQIMEEDIKRCKQMGADGIVIGALDENNELNLEVLERLIGQAGDMELVFHMAFNLIEDKKAALDKLIDLGINRVLTSGGEGSAFDNMENLKELIEYAKDRITILPGGGITEDNYMELVEKTGAKEVHGTKIVGSLSR